MKGHSKKSWNLQKKLAVAMSLVNALNTTAPVALPYVNVARDMKAPGGQVQGLTEAFASHLYSTAQAQNYNVPDGSTTSVSVGTMYSGDTMSVNNDGTGTVSNMRGGEQNISNGGTGTVDGMYGGKQNISNGGKGTVSSLHWGTQYVNDGVICSIVTCAG